MSEHDNVTSGGEQSQPTSGARRRFLTGLVTGGLLGSLLAGGASMYVQAHPSPGSWFGGRHSPSIPGRRVSGPASPPTGSCTGSMPARSSVNRYMVLDTFG
jgi:hypothetical protein